MNSQNAFDAGRRLAEQNKPVGPQGNMPDALFKAMVGGNHSKS